MAEPQNVSDLRAAAARNLGLVMQRNQVPTPQTADRQEAIRQYLASVGPAGAGTGPSQTTGPAPAGTAPSAQPMTNGVYLSPVEYRPQVSAGGFNPGLVTPGYGTAVDVAQPMMSFANSPGPAFQTVPAAGGGGAWGGGDIPGSLGTYPSFIPSGGDRPGPSPNPAPGGGGTGISGAGGGGAGVGGTGGGSPASGGLPAGYSPYSGPIPAGMDEKAAAAIVAKQYEGQPPLSEIEYKRAIQEVLAQASQVGGDNWWRWVLQNAMTRGG